MNKKEARLRRGRRTPCQNCRIEGKPLGGSSYQFAHLCQPDCARRANSGLEFHFCRQIFARNWRARLERVANVDAAVLVGKNIAEKAIKAGVTEVAFDRSGFRYHGRVKSIG